MSFDPFTAGFDLVKTGLDKIFPDANAELQGKLAEAAATISNEYNLQLAQIQANTEQAKHPSLFVAGPRPAAMWVCVLTLLYQGIGFSLLSWIAVCVGIPSPPVLPDTGAISALLTMLGLGGMRSYDKLNGIDTKRVGGSK